MKIFEQAWPSVQRSRDVPLLIYNPFPDPEEFGPISGEFRGVIDTGATHTSITNKVVRVLNLQPIGFIPCRDFGGRRQDLPAFMISLKLGSLEFQRLRVTGAGDDPGLDVLIGMDVLSEGNLNLRNGPGGTSVRFWIDN